MSHDLEQLVLLVLTGAGITLIGTAGAAMRWGALVSLCAQPWWLWVTWQAGQWGMFALAVLYTSTFARLTWLGFRAPRGEVRR